MIPGLEYIVCANVTDDGVTAIVATHRKRSPTTSDVELSVPQRFANASQLRRTYGIRRIHIPRNPLVAKLLRDVSLTPKEYDVDPSMSLEDFARARRIEHDPTLCSLRRNRR